MAKNSVMSVVSSLDEAAGKAVSAVGLLLGFFNGFTTQLSTSAFNSMVRIHNANMDNLHRLRHLAGNVGSSAVDLGASAVAETASVAGAVCRENERVLSRVPGVRRLVDLKSVAGLAAANGLASAAGAVKKIGGLAVSAVALKKDDRVADSEGVLQKIGGFLKKIEGLSGSDVVTVGLAVGTSDGPAGALNNIVGAANPESSFRIGQTIGRLA